MQAGKLQDLIAKPGLLFQVLGFGDVTARRLADAYAGFLGQTFARLGEIGLFIAEIGAQADISGYSFAMRDTASSSLSDATVNEIRK